MSRKTIRIVWYCIMGPVVISMVIMAFSGLGANIGNLTGTTQNGTGDAATHPTIGSVNGTPLYQDDFDNSLNNYQQMYSMMGRTIPISEMGAFRAQVLDSLIQDALLVNSASKMNISASDAEIQDARTKQIQQDNLAAKLSLSPSATQSQIDNALVAIGHAPTSQMYPDDKLRDKILVQKVHDALDAQTVVTDADARAYYTQWHVRHILVGNKSRSDAQAQIVAEKIDALAHAPGADFAALARTYTEDFASKSSGGDDSWIDQTTQYVPEFKSAAFALKPGQITVQPVASPQDGYFIIKCEAIRSNLPKDYDKNKASYLNTVQQTLRQQKFDAYIAVMKNDPATKIVITDARLRADQEMGFAQSAGDPGKKNLEYQAALADYKAALPTEASTQDAGEINSQIANIYETLNDPKDELPALQLAAQQTLDPQLNLKLGQLYQSTKDVKDALVAYKTASTEDWNDIGLHYQLIGIYKQLNRPDLEGTEQTWLSNYEKQQKAAQASQSSPGGQGVSVVPASGTPAAPAPAPVQ